MTLVGVSFDAPTCPIQSQMQPGDITSMDNMTGQLDIIRLKYLKVYLYVRLTLTGP